MDEQNAFGSEIEAGVDVEVSVEGREILHEHCFNKRRPTNGNVPIARGSITDDVPVFAKSFRKLERTANDIQRITDEWIPIRAGWEGFVTVAVLATRRTGVGRPV